MSTMLMCFFFVFLSQLEHPFPQIRRLLVLQDKNEVEYLAQKFKNWMQLFCLFRCHGLKLEHGFDHEVIHPASVLECLLHSGPMSILSIQNRDVNKYTICLIHSSHITLLLFFSTISF